MTAPDEKLEVVSTIWGPVMDHDREGRPRVERWVAHDQEGVNMGLLKIESAETLEDALRLANLSGSPRKTSWWPTTRDASPGRFLGACRNASASKGGCLRPGPMASIAGTGGFHPRNILRVIEPEDGHLWTANGRVVSGDMLVTLGDGGYDLGARAQQIRDDLRSTRPPRRTCCASSSMTAPCFSRLAKAAVGSSLASGNSRQSAASGNAALCRSLGRPCRDRLGRLPCRADISAALLLTQLSDVLVSPCKKIDKDFSIVKLDRTEGPVWRLVSERPEHLIDPRFKTWDELLLAAADDVIDDATKNDGKISDYTWVLTTRPAFNTR